MSGTLTFSGQQIGASDEDVFYGETLAFTGSGTLDPPAPAPEPSSLLLLGTGMIVLGMMAGRKRENGENQCRH